MGDVDSATIRVERSPKTKRGRRNIALPPDAIAILRAHKVKTLELRLALGMGNITPETWIFSTIEGELLSPDNLSRDWRRISTAKKLPRVSFHALRHTNASVLISRGVDYSRSAGGLDTASRA
jgi:integrase